MVKTINERRSAAGAIANLKRMVYLALALSILSMLVAGTAVFKLLHSSPKTAVLYINKTTNNTNTSAFSYNINGSLIVPPLSRPGSPVINVSQQFGSRLTNINEGLNASELSVINNAPLSYFETAGEMYLNRTLVNVVQASSKRVSPFIVNGKPSVIYLGSITCIFCGENRWAMALALSRFGSFSQLYKGYSALGDSDVPTLYWSPASYNQSTVDLGAFYNSSYITFIVLEDTAPISGGFVLQPLNLMQQEINRTGNPIYSDAMAFVLGLNNFQGTPYTIWGADQVGGADAVDFGNSMPSNSTLPLTYMTHRAVLQQLSKPSNQFAWTEYAAADIYIAMTCSSINNAAPVCTLPAISAIERANGY